jgi:hypothetical protein
MTVNVSKPAINVREKLAELDKPTGIAGEAMLRAETPQEQFNLIGAGRRNIFINGDYQISQRGDYTTEVDAANDSYFVDRWKIRNSKGTASYMKFQVITNDLPPHLSYGRVVKCSANASYVNTEHMGFRQFIENYQELAGKTVTYSAWVKSDVPTTIWIWQQGGTNISDISTPHSGNGQWELLTVTSTIRSSGNTAIASYITTYGNALSGGDYHMSTQHQLELGKVATPFEHRSYGEELALCQRYYYKLASGGNGFISMGAYYTASNVRSGLHFPVTMRAGPTLDMTSVTSGYRFLRNGASDYFANLAIDHSQATGCVLFNNSEVSGTAGQAGDLATASSSAYIAFDAEL